MKSVSVVMTTYNRAPLLRATLASIRNQCYQNLEVIVVDDGNDNGASEEVCSLFSDTVAKFIKREREPGTFYSNPSVPNNLGLKAATGDLVILQNAECMHHENVIEKFVEQTPFGTASFAMVEALTPQGTHYMWYTHPIFNRRPFFFCGAMARTHFVELRGFDENFRYYGFDDDQFSLRMENLGIKNNYSTNIRVSHLWHGPSYKPQDLSLNQQNENYFNEWKIKFEEGKVGLKMNLEDTGWRL